MKICIYLHLYLYGIFPVCSLVCFFIYSFDKKILNRHHMNTDFLQRVSAYVLLNYCFEKKVLNKRHKCRAFLTCMSAYDYLVKYILLSKNFNRLFY